MTACWRGLLVFLPSESLGPGVKLVANGTGRWQVYLVEVEIGVVVERAIPGWPCERLACSWVDTECDELLAMAKDFYRTSIAIVVDPCVRFDLGKRLFRPVDEQLLRGTSDPQWRGAQ